jgi:hypothetical protein
VKDMTSPGSFLGLVEAEDLLDTKSHLLRGTINGVLGFLAITSDTRMSISPLGDSVVAVVKDMTSPGSFLGLVEAEDLLDG